MLDTWILRMLWRDLLFAHWPVPAALIQPHLPAGLLLDTFDGAAYLGVVPFTMTDVSPRGVPSLPRLHTFPELNLRTYVTANGVRGVWFFSLDAGQRLAVRIARRCFHLPYFDAAFSVDGTERITYSAQRTHAGQPPLRFAATYAPDGASFRSRPGTLEHWLTERYCLYSADPRGRVYRAIVEHAPWSLQRAAAMIDRNELAQPLGIALDAPPSSLLFAKSLEVRARRIRPI